MGKRTRFQEKDIAQLVLTVKNDSKLPSDQPGYVTLPVDKLPKVCARAVMKSHHIRLIEKYMDLLLNCTLCSKQKHS